MISKKNGIEFEYVKGNSQSTVNLVFVHGSGCNKSFLRPIQEYVSEYNCYFIDLPGHGESDDTGYSVENYVNATSNFVKDLDNVILLGHSLGGTIVLAVAGKSIPSVKGAVIISSGSSFPKLDKEFLKNVHNGILDIDGLLAAGGNPDNPLVQKAGTQLDPPEVMIKDFILGEVVNVDSCLKDINIPVSIVTGGSEVLALVEYSENLHEKIKNSKLTIIPDTMHMLPIVRRKEIADIINDLIKSIQQ